MATTNRGAVSEAKRLFEEIVRNSRLKPAGFILGDLPGSESLQGPELMSELPPEDLLAPLLLVGSASLACCLPFVPPATVIIKAECLDSAD
jgi:hypothetical protein